jgi:predicted ATPase
MAAWNVLYKAGKTKTDEKRSAANNRVDEDILQKASKWLIRLNTGYRIKYKEYFELDVENSFLQLLTTNQAFDLKHEEMLSELNKNERKGKMVLIDDATQKELFPEDVGEGISQVVPIVAAAVDEHRGMLAVEQPELHVHPAIQVNLGDMFIQRMHDSEGLTILETHSEHLVLRVMRRMRETFSGKLEDKRLTICPSDIALLYIERHDGETIVREMPLNKKGELVKAWPGGFFEEGLNEVMS